MRSASADFLRDDGAQAMLARLCNLIGTRSFAGFHQNEKLSVIMGTIEMLKNNTQQREMLMTRDDVVVAWDIDKTGKKPVFVNFRLQISH